MNLKYQAKHYDEYLSLRIPFFLWLSVIYSVCHYLLLVLPALLPIDMTDIDWIATQSNKAFLVNDILGIFVLWASGNRISSAPSFAHKIWKNGKKLLLANMSLNFLLFLYVNNDLVVVFNQQNFFLLSVGLLPNILIISYLVRSDLINDVFAELPIPPTS